VAIVNASNGLLWSTLAADVAILRWPDQAEEARRLDQLGRPRLLIVSADDPPPPTESCLEDWVRVPATDEDVAARVAARSRHADRHPTLPTIDSWGQLEWQGATVLLSPRELVIAEMLVEKFEQAVRDNELIERAWPAGDGSPTALRVHAHRLRKRVAPVGLSLTSIRGYGYLLRRAATTS